MFNSHQMQKLGSSLYFAHGQIIELTANKTDIELSIKLINFGKINTFRFNLTDRNNLENFVKAVRQILELVNKAMYTNPTYLTDLIIYIYKFVSDISTDEVAKPALLNKLKSSIKDKYMRRYGIDL